MEIHLVLAHPDSSFHAGVPDSVINRTLRRCPAVSMDVMRVVGWMVPHLWGKAFVLGVQVLDPVLGFMVVVWALPLPGGSKLMLSVSRFQSCLLGSTSQRAHLKWMLTKPREMQAKWRQRDRDWRQQGTLPISLRTLTSTQQVSRMSDHGNPAFPQMWEPKALEK